MEGKQLKFLDIFSLCFGAAIGSGFFVLLGIGISYTGRSISLVLILGCFLMLFAFMYNIILVSMFPFKGGPYSQMALLFSPVMTGVNAIFILLVGFSLSIYATGMVSYASEVFHGITPYTKLIAGIVITLFFATTIKGSKFIATIQNIMTFVLIASILIFIFFGITEVKSGYFEPATFFRSGFSGFVAALALMGFTCMGTTGGIALTAVTKNATRTIPIAILTVTIVLAVVYALMSVVASGVLPIEQVAGKSLATVARAIFPYWAYVVFILGGAVFALTTSLLAAIAALRYPISQIAEDGWLPKFFTGKTKNGYPWVTQLTFYIISIIPIMFDISFDAIVSLVMIPTMLITMYCNLKCIGIPKLFPEQWKRSIFHMPMPLYVVIMLLSAAADLFVAYNLFAVLKPVQMIYMVSAFGVCILLAFIRIKTKAVDLDRLMKTKNAVIEEAENV